MTIDQLKESVLVVGGSAKSENWDQEWRLKLVENVDILANQLAKVGFDTLYLDGSFVENKDHPNDIDGYFNCDEEDLAFGRIPGELNALDPFKIWTWSGRTPYPGYAKPQLPMWHRYRVEIYPNLGQPFFEGQGESLNFYQAFRQTRLGAPKGIVKLITQKESSND